MKQHIAQQIHARQESELENIVKQMRVQGHTVQEIHKYLIHFANRYLAENGYSPNGEPIYSGGKQDE